MGWFGFLFGVGAAGKSEYFGAGRRACDASIKAQWINASRVGLYRLARFRGLHFLKQCFDSAFATVFTALGQHGFGLIGCGSLNVPTQHAPVKGLKNFAAAGAGAQEQNDANIGAGKILNQAGQQLHFMVGERAGVVHDHDAGGRLLS